MKFLVVCRPRAGASMDHFASLVPDEAAALRRLKARGTLVQAWSPGEPGAVLIVEADNQSNASSIIGELPLSAANLLDHELIALHDIEL